MNEVKAISNVTGGFVAASVSSGDRVDIYNVQRPIDGKISYGQVHRPEGICEIYNPNFEIMSLYNE